MYINYSEYSSIGGREKNEDMVQITSCPNGTIVLVADGLGGHGDGDVASRLAVHVIGGEIYNHTMSLAGMERAVQRANDAIIEKNAGKNNMKTTISALWFWNRKACAAHVGDTRIYQFRRGKILYQSMDHSVSQMSVMMGEITLDQIRGHCDRSKLTRALGSKSNVKVDAEMLDVASKDAFLLCSDGFWELITEDEMIRDLESASSAEQWLSSMLERIKGRMQPDADNCSAAVVMVY